MSLLSENRETAIVSNHCISITDSWLTIIRFTFPSKRAMAREKGSRFCSFMIQKKPSKRSLRTMAQYSRAVSSTLYPRIRNETPTSMSLLFPNCRLRNRGRSRGKRTPPSPLLTGIRSISMYVHVGPCEGFVANFLRLMRSCPPWQIVWESAKQNC